jgi:hypothetical protein
MKFIVIIMLLYGSLAYGQRRQGKDPYGDRSRLAQFQKEDSLEGFYINYTHLNVITDSLPLYTFDENSGWRDMKLVDYYYDSMSVLKKIYFRNGREGYYYFYFEGLILMKASSFKWTQSINKYYFSIEENKYTISEMEQKMTQEPEKKDLFETLKIGKNFIERFKTLL